MTVNERLQHAALMVSFFFLVVTGFMLRFPDVWWVVVIRGWSVHFFAGRSLIHRGAAVAMVVGGVWHAIYLVATPRGRQLVRDLWPRWQDVTDALGVLRYNLGLARTKPRFGRFSYIEKAEYWALIWGSVIMTGTGAFLWFENTFIGLLTKRGYDISRVVHFYEAVLATLAIVVWHFYFVIFNPDVYPMNLAWLTGRISEKEMHEDHPLELEQIKAERADEAAAALPPEKPAEPRAEPPP
jgi:cytochrome b subunit of formate dehydrogenase